MQTGWGGRQQGLQCRQLTRLPLGVRLLPKPPPPLPDSPQGIKSLVKPRPLFLTGVPPLRRFCRPRYFILRLGNSNSASNGPEFRFSLPFEESSPLNAQCQSVCVAALATEMGTASPGHRGSLVLRKGMDGAGREPAPGFTKRNGLGGGEIPVPEAFEGARFGNTPSRYVKGGKKNKPQLS